MQWVITTTMKEEGTTQFDITKRFNYNNIKFSKESFKVVGNKNKMQKGVDYTIHYDKEKLILVFSEPLSAGYSIFFETKIINDL